MRNESILMDLLDGDLAKLRKAEESYGHSWISRGLRGAYFVMVRKIDRFENQMRQVNFDLPAALRAFPGKDGILDDIRDLRQYLFLIEAEIIAQDRLTMSKARGITSDAPVFDHRGVEPNGDDRWYCGMCSTVFSMPHDHSPYAKHECPALVSGATGSGYVDQARDASAAPEPRMHPQNCRKD